MFLRIEKIESKKLVGQKLEMSLAQNRTFELWSGFMPRRFEIKNLVDEKVRYSMQIYDENMKFEEINLNTVFTKWAALEVSEFDEIPEKMQKYELKGGLYAVFLHRGLPKDFQKTLQYIYGFWLPNSAYILDNREHFEVLGEKYRNNQPDSEEEVWVPILKK